MLPNVDDPMFFRSKAEETANRRRDGLKYSGPKTACQGRGNIREEQSAMPKKGNYIGCVKVWEASALKERNIYNPRFQPEGTDHKFQLKP